MTNERREIFKRAIEGGKRLDYTQLRMLNMYDQQYHQTYVSQILKDDEKVQEFLDQIQTKVEQQYDELIENQDVVKDIQQDFLQQEKALNKAVSRVSKQAGIELFQEKIEHHCTQVIDKVKDKCWSCMKGLNCKVHSLKKQETTLFDFQDGFPKKCKTCL